MAVALWSAALVATPEDAAAHGSCTAVRMRASGNKCRAIIKCHVNEARRGVPAAPCVAEQLTKLEKQFDKSIIYGDCHTYGEPADVVPILDAGVVDLAATLQLDTNPCAAAKIGAAGRNCF